MAPSWRLLLDLDEFESRAMSPPDDWAGLADPRLAGLIALDDPRHAPVTTGS